MPATIKRDLLADLVRAKGISAVLQVGQSLDHVSIDPIWAAALSSSDPWVLLDKWQRFERFAHWNNRSRQSPINECSVRIERFGVDGNGPTGLENLLVCGLHVGLLARIGCARLSCRLGQKQTTEIDGKGRVLGGTAIDLEDTDLWEITWAPFQHGTAGRAIENKSADSPILHTAEGPAPQLAELLRQDLSRPWSLADLARAGCMSERTLQRRLTEADLSFSKLVRVIRIHEASKMLTNTDLPITVIGFCVGFSDSAHFSRDFGNSVGVSPRAYRKLVSGASSRANSTLS